MPERKRFFLLRSSLSWVPNDPAACSCRDYKIGGERAKATMKGCQTGKGRWQAESMRALGGGDTALQK